MTCPKCNDLGYLEDRAHNAMVRWCDCPAGRRVYKLQWDKKLEDAGIPLEFWNLSFNDFCPQQGFKSHLVFMRDLEFFLKNIETHRAEGTMWLICGESGVGKTLGAACILRQAIRRDYKAKYTVWTTIVDATLSTFEKDILEDILDVDFLVIDDLGNDKINVNTKSNYSADLLEKIIKPRYSNKRPTILVSSKQYKDLIPKYPILQHMIPDEWRSYVTGESFRTKKIAIKPPSPPKQA